MNVENKHTEIQFKRTSENSTFIEDGGVIKKGEPFYDSNNQHLYVGNNDSDELKSKKHIAQVTKEYEIPTELIYTLESHIVPETELLHNILVFESDYPMNVPGCVYLTFVDNDEWKGLYNYRYDARIAQGVLSDGSVGNIAIQKLYIRGEKIQLNNPVDIDNLYLGCIIKLDIDSDANADATILVRDDIVDFSVGENLDNRYRKQVDHVSNSRNVENSIRDLALEDIFEFDSNTNTMSKVVQEARKLTAEPHINGVKFDGTRSVENLRYSVVDIDSTTDTDNSYLQLTLSHNRVIQHTNYYLENREQTEYRGLIIYAYISEDVYEDMLDSVKNSGKDASELVVQLKVDESIRKVTLSRESSGESLSYMYVSDLWPGFYAFKYTTNSCWMCIGSPTKNVYTAENLNPNSKFKFDALDGNMLRLTVGDRSIGEKLDIQDYNKDKGSIKEKFEYHETKIQDIIDGDIIVGKAQETVDTPYIGGFPASNNSHKFATPMYYTKKVDLATVHLELLPNTTYGQGEIPAQMFWNPQVGFRFWWYNNAEIRTSSLLKIRFKTSAAVYSCIELTASGTGSTTATEITPVLASSIETGWYEFEVVKVKESTSVCRLISSPKSDEWATF